MATVTTELLNDDLDNRIQTGVETVTFFDPRTGEKREIELGEANRRHLAAHFEKLDKYLDVSRKVEDKPARKPAGKNDENAKIRAWAQANGFQIGDRGRIKAEIVEAYRAAQGAVATVDAEAQANTQARAEATGLESASVELPAEIEAQLESGDLDEIFDFAPEQPEGTLVEATDNMDADEFAAFLAANMDADGNVNAHTVDTEAHKQ